MPVVTDPDTEVHRVVEALERAAIDGGRPRGKSPVGILWGLAEGYLGTLLTAGRYEFFYDPNLLDPAEVRERARSDIGGAVDLVHFVPSAHSATELAEVLSRIGQRDWHPMVTTVPYGFSLNVREAVIEVDVDDSAPPDLIAALQSLGPGLVRISTGHHMRRGRGR
jgi:hypothetical protein